MVLVLALAATLHLLAVAGPLSALGVAAMVLLAMPVRRRPC